MHMSSSTSQTLLSVHDRVLSFGLNHHWLARLDIYGIHWGRAKADRAIKVPQNCNDMQHIRKSMLKRNASIETRNFYPLILDIAYTLCDTSGFHVKFWLSSESWQTAINGRYPKCSVGRMYRNYVESCIISKQLRLIQLRIDIFAGAKLTLAEITITNALGENRQFPLRLMLTSCPVNSAIVWQMQLRPLSKWHRVGVRCIRGPYQRDPGSVATRINVRYTRIHNPHINILLPSENTYSMRRKRPD